MNEDELPEITLDADSLYREETITDRRAGLLRCMVPIKADGSDDEGRAVLYLGQAQLMTQMGPLPVSFEIEASSLEEALRKFPEAAKEGIKHTIDELQEMRREAASSIITPGQGGGMGGFGGGVPPQAGPGGGIQLP